MLGWFNTTLNFWPEWADGLRITVLSSALSFAIAFGLGIVGALARRSRLWPLRFLATAYVEAIRNTPVLLQIFIIYFGAPAFGVHPSAFSAGVAALSINAGAYLTEIMRAGIQSVPAGQVEAATVLDLGKSETFRHVVFPQAVRYVYPPVINQFVQIILGSSLLSTIALQEITGVAQTVNSQTLQTFQVFTFALILYLVLTNILSIAADLFARHAFHPPLEKRAKSFDGGLGRRLRLMIKGA